MKNISTSLYRVGVREKMRYTERRPMEHKKHSIRVCVNTHCKCNGSEKIFDKLVSEQTENWELSKTDECFRYCKQGPNVAVNGNVLHHIHPESATRRIQAEIENPSPRKDVVGTRGLDELDSVLDDLISL